MFENLFKSAPMIQDYGNGVFRFNCYGNTLGFELAKFKKDNPHLTITAISIDTLFEFHGTCLVITEPKM